MTDFARRHAPPRGQLFRSLTEQSFCNADLALLIACSVITSVIAALGIVSFLR